MEAETFGAEGFWQRLFRRKRRFPNYRADDLMEISLQGKDEEVLRELFITTAKKKGLEEEIVERFSYGYWGGPIPDGVDIPLEQIVGTNEYNGLAWDTMVYEMLEMQENGSALKAWDELGWDSKADMEKAIKGAETFEAVHDDYLISMQRNNPLSRHYIPPKKKSAETFGAEEIYGVCPYCGFDAEAAVAYQSKQNDETLTPDQIHDEVEFYLYESHPDFCEGMRNSIKEADYTIDMINSHGVKWSGNIIEKKDGYKKYRADFEYHYNMSSKYAGSDVLDTLRNSSDTTKAEAIDWLIDNGFLHSDEQYNAAYVLALGDAIGISDDYESETFEAYNPEQPRDESGRWISDKFNLSEYDFNETPTHGSKITLRQLSEAVMETTHNNLDFDTAHAIVNKMLSQHPAGDSQEARTALLLTLEETHMQLEYADEIGWDMDLEIMAGLLRSHGIQPPEEYEEAVINRLTFEDEWAAEPGWVSGPDAEPYPDEIDESLLEEYQQVIAEWEVAEGTPPSFNEYFNEAYWKAKEKYDREEEIAHNEYMEYLSTLTEEEAMEEMYGAETTATQRKWRIVKEYPHYITKEQHDEIIEALDYNDPNKEIFYVRYGDTMRILTPYAPINPILNGSFLPTFSAESIGYDKPLGESLNWTPYEYGDSKKNKPNKPTPAKDFDIGDTFGRNVLLMSEDEDPEPELKKYMVGVPVLHSYAVGPVEAYNEEEAEYEVRNNWRYWRRTIDNNGDWGGPIWRYRGITIDEPEAYETFESNNYQCISCGLSFAQEDTRDIDGDIVCDDCIYNIYGMDA